MQNKLLEKLMLLIFFWVTSNYADTYESAITNHKDFIPSQSSQWIVIQRKWFMNLMKKFYGSQKNMNLKQTACLDTTLL